MAYTDRPTTFADEYFQHGQMYVQDTTQLVAPTGFIVIAITALEASTVITELSPENGITGLSVGSATNEYGGASVTNALGDSSGASGGDLISSSPLGAGVTIYGRWLSLTLSGGSVMAYIRKA